MRKIFFWTAFFLILFTTHIFPSDFQFIGDVTNYTQKRNVIEVQCTNAKIELTILADDVFRVRMTSDDKFPSDYSYTVLPLEKSVTPFPVVDEGDKIKISSKELILEVTKSPCRLAFYDSKGDLICKDHDSYGMGWNGTKVCCWKKLHDEPFFGLGEKTRGLNKRGNVYTMWNSDIPGYTTVQDPLYQSHPFFLSMYQGRGFGIYFDNPYRSQFNFAAGTDQFYSFGADDGMMDYYFLYGPDFKKILNRYGELVGTMPLPPK